VNWDFIRFKYRNENNRTIKRTLALANPLDSTKTDVEKAFLESDSLAQLLDALGAPPEDKPRVKFRASSGVGSNAGSKGLMGLWDNQLTTWASGP
jgi:hypothetical protein